MAIEFSEEAGLVVPYDDWNHLCDVFGDEWFVSFWWTVGDLHRAKAMTDEQIFVYNVDYLPQNVIPNLKWLIPLAMDRTTDPDKITKNVSVHKLLD